MKRLAVLSLTLFALAACGGGETATAPIGNGAEADVMLPVDEPVYSGDNLTIIDAAANDASAQTLVPDAPAGDTGNEAAAVATNGAGGAD